MSTDWKPRAPAAKTAFNGPESGKATSTTEHTPPTPSTKTELDRLESQREVPMTAQQFTPGGDSRRTADTSTQRHKEARILELRQRLGRMRGRARDDFDRSR